MAFKAQPIENDRARAPSLAGRLLALSLATITAGGGGVGLAWLVETGRLTAVRAGSGAPAAAKVRKGALKIVPSILVSLEGAARPWLRLDLALLYDAEAAVSDAQAADYAHEVLAYLRTRRPEDLQGPSSLPMLSEDLQEIARRRAGSAVQRVLIRSLVIE